MNNKKELFEILDEALERVLKGEDIDNVLADYPRRADELEPLLRTALITRDAAALTPRPEFRKQAALDFQRAIQQMPLKSGGRPAVEPSVKQHRGIFGWGAAWSVSIATLLVVLLSGTGVVAAANRAMPDSPLYSVKLAAENVQYALTPSRNGKANLLVTFNDRRVDELVNMADKGNAAEIGVLNTNLTSNMAKISDLTAGRTQFTANNESANNKSTFGSSSRSQDTAVTTPASTTSPPTTPAAVMIPSPLVPATTPAPTTAPATAPVPAVTRVPTVTPAPTVTPTITVNIPPATTTLITIPPPAANSNEKLVHSYGLDSNSDQDKWAKLRELLTEKQYQNLQQLWEAYNRAPDSLKPSIQQAIDIIISGYGMSLSNLAQ